MNRIRAELAARIPKNLHKPLRIVLGIAIGAGCGYLVHIFIGCPTGGCAITGNPLNSTLYGAAMGLIFSIT